MPIRTTINLKGIYFITFTCYRWLPLIEITNSYDLIYNWFDLLKKRHHLVTGYVIMPNHLHALIYYAHTNQSLITIVGKGKRFMAYEIVNRLKNTSPFYLAQMKLAVHKAEKLRGKKHEVWEDSFDVKDCRTEKFLLQKLNYIHNNPCSKGWSLAPNPEEYIHSSAAFYHEPGPSDILTHYKEILPRLRL